MIEANQQMSEEKKHAFLTEASNVGDEGVYASGETPTSEVTDYYENKGELFLVALSSIIYLLE